jgi:1,4-dihydroxy-2-naphthoate octaprenyltransferase
MADAALNRLLGVVRAPFLPLTPACLLVGVAAAVYDGGPLIWANLGAVLVAALAGHASVNALNEYADYRSGLDRYTLKTPFSGGSGTLVADPGFAPAARRIGIVALGVCTLCGLYLLIAAGWGLLPLGLAGVLIVVGYTPWINRYPLLCLLAPGIGFGPVMVAGTAYALTGTYSTAAWIASTLPLFAVSNLLLLNQFPDVEPDRRAGRRHLPVVIGCRGALKVFAALWLLAYLTIAAAVAAALLPATALLALAGLPAVGLTVVKVWNRLDRVDALVPWMGVHVAVVLLSPVLLATGLFVG